MQQLTVVGETIHWPELCACCSRSPTGTVTQTTSRTANYLVIETTRTLELRVPYCDACARHVRWNEDTPLWVKTFVLFLVSGLSGLLLGIYLFTFNPSRPTLGSLALASPLIVTGLYVRQKLSQRPAPLGEEHVAARAAVHVGYFGKEETRLLVLNDTFASALSTLNEFRDRIEG